jgi:hypothetical protein
LVQNGLELQEILVFGDLKEIKVIRELRDLKVTQDLQVPQLQSKEVLQTLQVYLKDLLEIQ